MSVEKTYLVKKEETQGGKLKEVTLGCVVMTGKDPSTRINRAMIWCANNSGKREERFMHDIITVYTLVGEYTNSDAWRYKRFDRRY